MVGNPTGFVKYEMKDEKQTTHQLKKMYPSSGTAVSAA